MYCRLLPSGVEDHNQAYLSKYLVYLLGNHRHSMFRCLPGKVPFISYCCYFYHNSYECFASNSNLRRKKGLIYRCWPITNSLLCSTIASCNVGILLTKAHRVIVIIMAKGPEYCLEHQMNNPINKTLFSGIR